MNKQLLDNLNKQVADWTVLYMKLHNFHWFVKGEQFFTLHELFEQHYDAAAERIDELAERILAKGGKPVATLKEILSLSTLQEAEGHESASDMVEAIIADYRKLLEEIRVGIRLAEEQEDDGTADLLITTQTELEKQIWMLQAFLNA